MTQQNRGLGEQALDKAAEIGLASQLDEVENLDVVVNLSSRSQTLLL